jgi:DNA-binding response OmpR family regulator
MATAKELLLDLIAGLATYESQRVAPSRRESKLAADARCVLSREEIVDDVWGGAMASLRAVDVMVSGCGCG